MKNVRISGLPELENEETKSLAIKFFAEDLHLNKPVVVQAFRVGTKGLQPRTILVRFADHAQRDTVMANKAILKGRRIWIDPDLTPLQAQAKRKELQKVKDAQSQGFIVFLT